MIVIATNNGMEFLPRLLKSLESVKEKILIADTGSTDPVFLEYLKTLKNVAYCDGGWSPGAYKYAYDNYKDDWYFFMHDSMEVKDINFLDNFKQHDVCTWLYFPIFFDDPTDEAVCRATYPLISPIGIFGPIFYAKRSALDKITLEIPNTLNEAHNFERGLACAFHSAGIKINHIHEMIEDKIINDGYPDLKKWKPQRP